MRKTSRTPDGPRLRSLALALAEGVGPKTYHDLLERFGSAERAFDVAIAPGSASAALAGAAEVLDSAARRGATVLLFGDADYPRTLGELPDPPPYLVIVGDRAVLDRRLVAIVGTRDATPYGERTTRTLAEALAASGVGVVSGMARGIDAVAHAAALDARGATIAVLGTGVDVAYPQSNRYLHARIAAEGLVVSESPCGARPTKGSFPRRNRIIAALAEATIVVEAGAKSGALITAGCALELGRTVAAVPGPIDAPASAGSNELIRDGAVVIAAVDDALALVGASAARPAHRATLSADEAAVFAALSRIPLSADRLAVAVALPPSRCAVALSTLELAGLVESTLTGELRVVR